MRLLAELMYFVFLVYGILMVCLGISKGNSRWLAVSGFAIILAVLLLYDQERKNRKKNDKQ